MKILHVINSLECGGLEKFVIDLSQALVLQGHECVIACLQPGGDLSKLTKNHNIKVITYSKKNGIDWSLIFSLRKLIREQKIDIVHTHNPAPLKYGTIAAILAGNPNILNTRHGRVETRVPSIFWVLNKAVVTISHDAKESLLKCNRLDRHKIQVIHNGINLKMFDVNFNREEQNKLKQTLGLKENTFIIGNVGRLVKEKDQASLIKALRKLVPKKIEIQLVLVGEGPLRKNLEDLVRDLNVSDHVKFLGYRDYISRILQIIDVFILSSYTEGISIALLEAMASGKPVIATKVGGNPEVVVDGESGFLVPCGFPERIEAAVMKFYANPSLIKRMGQNGRERVQNLFNMDQTVSQYEQLYLKILEKRN